MPNIDNRIVQMSFDNSGFEKKANTTISTLEKLKASMDFGEASKTLSEYQQHVDKFSLRTVTNAVADVKAHFDLWEVAAIGVITNIASKATDAGVKIMKSLSIDQVTSGWNKFNDAIAAEQTIMSAIEGKFDQNGVAYDMDGVIQRIEKLRTYSDETSYSLSQMTNAIGTFTASGVDLDVATQAIMGVSNACADAGVSTQKAESAYIAFAKAIGTGNLTLSQWNMQLKTSGLTNSERFRQSLIDAAEAEGTLIRQGEKLITVTTKEEVTTANLESTLTDGKWANTKVMLRALSGYSDTVDGLLSSGKIDLTSQAFDSLKTAMAEQGKTLDDLGLDKEYDTVSQSIKVLKNAYKQLGLEVPKSVKAFARAQEAISLSQAIDSVKEAVSSGWAKTYETIFGNYDEARQLWTDVANDMWDWFASSGEVRNEIFESWKSLWKTDTDDEEAAVTQIIALWRDFAAVVNTVRNLFKDSLSDGLGLDFAENIDKIAEHIYNFIESIRSGLQNIRAYMITSDDTADVEKVSDTFKWFGDIVKGVTSVFTAFGKIISSVFNNLVKPVVKLLGPTLQNIVNIFGNLGETLLYGTEVFDKLGLPKINSVLEKIVDTLKPLATFIENITSNLVDISGKIRDSIMSKLLDESKDGAKTFNIFGLAIDLFSKSLDTLKSLLDGTLSILEKVKDIGVKVAKVISDIFNKIVEIMTTPFGDSSLNPIGLGAVVVLFQKIFDFKWNIFDVASSAIGIIKDITGSIGELFSELSGAIDGFALSEYATSFKNIATTMLIFSGAVLILSSISSDNLAKAVTAITVIGGLLVGYIKLLNVISSGKKLGAEKMMGITATLIVVSAAVLELSLAAKMLAGTENLGVGLGAVAGILAGMVIFITVLDKLDVRRVTKGLTSLLGLASALVVMSLAVKILASMDLDDLVGKGLFGIGAMLVEIGAFIVAMDKLTGTFGGAKILAISASMVVMAGALAALTGIVYVLGSINTEKLSQGLSALGVLLIEIGAFMGVMSMAGGFNLIAMSTAMLIISGAVLALSASLVMLAKTNLASLVKSITVLVISLTAIGGMAALLGIASPLILATGAAFLVLGAGMKVIAEGMVAFAGASVLFSAAGTSIADALTTIAAGIIGIIPMIIVGFAKAIVDVAGQVVKIVGQLITIVCNAIVDNLPTVISTGFLLLLTFLQGIRDNIYQVAALGIEVVLQFMAAIGDQVQFITDGIVNLLIQVINAVANTIRDKSEDFGAALGNLAEALLEGIIRAIFSLQFTFAEKIVEFGRDVIDGIKGWFNGDSGEDSTKEIGTEAIGELATGMDSKKSAVKKSSESIGDEVKEGVDVSDETPEIGKNVVEGFISEIASSEAIQRAYQAGWDLGHASTQGLHDGSDSHSPSKEAARIGGFVVQGLVNGIQTKMFMAENAGYDTGSILLDALTDAMHQANNLIDDELNHPVITPILDLSNIRNNASALNGLLNQNGVGFTMASNAINPAKVTSEGETLTGGVAPASYSFVQNNYSPKALSTIDIYRQTKNQFALMKGMVTG